MKNLPFFNFWLLMFYYILSITDSLILHTSGGSTGGMGGLFPGPGGSGAPRGLPVGPPARFA